jgi:hypothetical protein
MGKEKSIHILHSQEGWLHNNQLNWLVQPIILYASDTVQTLAALASSGASGSASLYCMYLMHKLVGPDHEAPEVVPLNPRPCLYNMHPLYYNHLKQP